MNNNRSRPLLPDRPVRPVGARQPLNWNVRPNSPEERISYEGATGIKRNETKRNAVVLLLRKMTSAEDEEAILRIALEESVSDAARSKRDEDDEQLERAVLDFVAMCPEKTSVQGSDLFKQSCLCGETIHRRHLNRRPPQKIKSEFG